MCAIFARPLRADNGLDNCRQVIIVLGKPYRHNQIATGQPMPDENHSQRR
jgi:hypothetical protein